jgi:hypothetical protein
MSEPAQTHSCPGAWASAGVTAVLAASAVFSVGYGIMLALGQEDTEALESPLLLAVARQLLAGPLQLYGPFGRRNLLVLIHAPLYYRLAALAAWPLAWGGVDPVTSARWAGRALSLLGLGVTMSATYRMARLDRAPARAGWWAALLIPVVPVVGIMPFTVRPDMLGVALQTTGVLLVLRALRSEQPPGAVLTAAFTAFGLSICIKQHFVAGPVTSTCLLLAACRRGRVAFGQIQRSLLFASALVLALYGIEELASSGRMSQAVFIAAMKAARTHPAEWLNTVIVLSAITGRSTSVIALLAAAGLATVGAGPGFGRRAFALLGTGLVVLVLITAVIQSFLTAASVVILSLTALLSCLLLVIPTCTLIDRRTLVAGPVDSFLWIFLAGELALVFVLCCASTGAWVNYGIQAVVFACILTARALARACDSAAIRRRLLLLPLAASVVLVSVLQDAYRTEHGRRVDRLAVAQILEELGRPSSEIFFVASPGNNRLYGRLDLVYDNWLYPVFESLRLAEPRASWLRIALTAGAVRFVVNTSDSPQIEGLDQTLPKLGYLRRFQIGPFFVWERITSRRALQAAGAQKTQLTDID